MTARRALIYATYDGVATIYHGIGSLAQSFLHYAALGGDALAEFDRVCVAYPEVRHDLEGYEYRPDVHDDALELMRRGGVEERRLAHGAPGEAFWSADNWDRLAESLGDLVLEFAESNDAVLVIAVDAVFVSLADVLDRRDPGWAEKGVTLVHALYSAGTHPGTVPMPERIEAEQACVDRANGSPTVFIADTAASFTSAMVAGMGLELPVPAFTLAIEPRREDYAPLPADTARTMLDEAGLLLEPPFVAFAGRTDPVKGFDVLVEALTDPDLTGIGLSAILAPYHASDPGLADALTALERSGIRYRHHVGFSRELLRAFCALPEVTAIVIPSRGEPIGMLYREAALWARDGGPVIVVSDADGLAAQVEDGVNGIVAEAGDAASLAGALRRALDLGAERDLIRSRALDFAMTQSTLDKTLIELIADLRRLGAPV